MIGIRLAARRAAIDRSRSVLIAIFVIRAVAVSGDVMSSLFPLPLRAVSTAKSNQRLFERLREARERAELVAESLRFALEEVARLDAECSAAGVVPVAWERPELSSVLISCDCCRRELVGSLSPCPGCGRVCRDCCECADPAPDLVADYLGRDLEDSG